MDTARLYQDSMHASLPAAAPKPSTMSDLQQNLFETEPAPWELDDQEESRVATVVFPEGVAGEFDYLIPNALEAKAVPGIRVKVPLGRGNRTVTAYCVDVQTKRTSRKLKELAEIIDEHRLLSPSMLQLTQWMSQYYVASWGRTIEAVLPAGVRGQSGTRERIFLSVSERIRNRLDEFNLPPKQLAAMKILAAATEPMTVDELAKAAQCTTGPITSLRRKELVEESTRRIHGIQPTSPQREKPELVELNEEQQKALEQITHAIDNRSHETFLLHGVTGSGKTEVYIRAIEKVIQFGQQAIVLVPEISLTPQTRRRFQSRFDNVAVLHSVLSDAERHWFWKEIASGKVQVVVGARSALFAPTPNLGLIVIDEEHDGSFKQDSLPRYHARDVAQKRAELEEIPLVLGTATPALESWQAANDGRFRLISMPNRVSELPLPAVHVVDLRDDFRKHIYRGGIGRDLNLAMKKTLKEGGQIILLLNRRGFSTHIQCPSCGEVVKCKDCDIALTHHRDVEKVICHYCDYETSRPIKCPSCKFEGIRFSGLGTQRLEAEVRSQFPNVECIRMDSDTMRRPGSHEEALSQFRFGKAKILLGTQMIAKGLDFPNVMLVGVINADTGLHLPDFRASERAFQLVTQVAGRTGRSERGGQVLVQSFNPDHPAIRAAKQHDYVMFANGELPQRKMFGYPPYGSMVRIVVRGEQEALTNDFAEAISEQIQEAFPQGSSSYRLLGPAPAPISRIRGLYRFHMIVQAPDLDAIRPKMLELVKSTKTPDSVQWIIDVDPSDML